MARLIGPDDRLVYRTDGTARAQGFTGVVYADGDGNFLADILTLAGDPIAGSVVTVDANSLLPLFQFPDSADTVYITVNGGPLVPLYARGDDRFDALAASVAGVASSAAAATRVAVARTPGISLSGATPAPVVYMGTALQAGHGYTQNAGGSTNLNDTSTFALGTQSASLTTDGGGTARTLRRTGMTTVSAVGRQPVFWVKIDDQSHLGACQLYLGDSTLANHFKWDLKSGADQKWITDGAWHRIVLSWTEASTGGSPTRSTITDAQFRLVDDNTGNPVTAHFNGWGLAAESTTWPNGVVSLTFDDTYASHYNVVRPILDKYGMAATAYIIQDYLGAAGRMTLQQLSDMQRYSGWEIAGHATTAAIHAARFTSLNPQQLDDEFSAIRQWLASNGFGDHVAYPGGEYNDDVLSAAERYFTGGVTVFQRPETLPPARRSKIRRGGYVTSATSTATLTAAIDAAYANRDWLVFGFHDIVTTPSQTSDYSTANLQTVIDYIAAKGIPVRTAGDVLRTRP